ncbi:hypothetical protein CTA1_9768 [Colletotrichum tanaceti]|uniref:Uncharacterized protein n=1 Tax=Colletotrichum tanaceti TaxID=1306861 RepID=A0A4U6X6H1_9PEZI|nr:hypothetical protein CTA1_9768 [Colletotrichum tanaceti]
MRPLADALYLEAKLLEFGHGDDVAPVEDESGTLHDGGSPLPVDGVAQVLVGGVKVAAVAALLALGLGLHALQGVRRRVGAGAGDELFELDNVHLGQGLLEEGVGLLPGRLGTAPDGGAASRRLGLLGVAEVVPGGEDADGAGPLDGVAPVGVDLDALDDALVGDGLADLVHDLDGVAARVEDGDLVGHLVGQLGDDVDGDAVARVVGILLEGEAEDGHLFAAQVAVEGAVDLLGEALALVLVDVEDAHPVVGDGVEVEGARHVGEVEDVLLEARAAEADAGVEELLAQAAVGADALADLLDVGAQFLAEGADAVDAADALGEHGVGHQLRELARPRVDRQDLGLGDPGAVHALEGVGGADAGPSGRAADQDPVGVHEIAHGGSLGEELGVGHDLELGVGLGSIIIIVIMTGRIGKTYNLANHAGGARRDGALLDNDGAILGELGHRLGGALEGTQVGRVAGAETVRLGRGVDADEDDVGLADAALDVRGKGEVRPTGGELHGLAGRREEGRRLVGAVAGDTHNLGQAGFVNGQMGRVPRRDALGVEVDDVDGEVGVVQRDESGSWATCVGGDLKSVLLVFISCRPRAEHKQNVPTKPAPTKQTFLTSSGSRGSRSEALEAVSCFRSGLRGREAGGDELGVPLPDPASE